MVDGVREGRVSHCGGWGKGGEGESPSVVGGVREGRVSHCGG